MVHPNNNIIGICRSRVIVLTFIITSSKSKINKVLSYCASSVFVIQSQFSLVGEAPQSPRTSPAEMASPSFGTLKKRRPFSYKRIRERRFRSTDRCISSSLSQDMSPAEASAHPFVIPSSCFCILAAVCIVQTASLAAPSMPLFLFSLSACSTLVSDTIITAHLPDTAMHHDSSAQVDQTDTAQHQDAHPGPISLKPKNSYPDDPVPYFSLFRQARFSLHGQ